jgi:hypothetical protein
VASNIIYFWDSFNHRKDKRSQSLGCHYSLHIGQGGNESDEPGNERNDGLNDDLAIIVLLGIVVVDFVLD